MNSMADALADEDTTGSGLWSVFATASAVAGAAFRLVVAEADYALTAWGPRWAGWVSEALSE